MSGAFPGPGSPMSGRKKPHASAIWLVSIGAVIVVASVAVALVLAFWGFGKVAGMADEAHEIEGSTTVELEAGSQWQFYGLDATSAPHGPGTCTVTGEGASTLAPGTNQTSTFTYKGNSYSSFDSIEVSTTGEYTFTCTVDDVVLAPPVSMGGIFGGVGGILVGVFGGILGFLLVIAGVIVWVVTRKVRP